MSLLLTDYHCFERLVVKARVWVIAKSVFASTSYSFQLACFRSNYCSIEIRNRGRIATNLAEFLSGLMEAGSI